MSTTCQSVIGGYAYSLKPKPQHCPNVKHTNVWPQSDKLRGQPWLRDARIRRKSVLKQHHWDGSALRCKPKQVCIEAKTFSENSTSLLKPSKQLHHMYISTRSRTLCGLLPCWKPLLNDGHAQTKSQPKLYSRRATALGTEEIPEFPKLL